jgi:uncharacterized cofD-like protein
MAKGKRVYICNVMTQAGETLNYTASDHVKALYDHMACPFIDTILVNDEDVPKDLIEKYAKELAKPVHYDIQMLESLGIQIIHGKIVSYEDGVIRHDTQKVAALLYTLLEKQDVSG